MDDEELVSDDLGPLGPPRPIHRTLQSFSLAFSSGARPEYELGDKILLPQSLLAELIQWNSTNPMIFRITAERSERVTHVGVIEFTAEEGKCYMPHWLMQNLALQEGDLIRLQTANLPKARYVKLQPHLTEFTYMTNPRAVLETRLRHFTALTQGDEIAIEYNGKTYWVTVISCEPAEAVCVTDTDVSVEFAPPRDMPSDTTTARPSHLADGFGTNDTSRLEFGSTDATSFPATTSRSLWKRKNEKAAEVNDQGSLAAGKGAQDASADATERQESYWDKLPGGRTLSGRPVSQSDSKNNPAVAAQTSARPSSSPTPEPESAKKFVPFSGTGRTLR
jgi:ubiquitin fusion degradation protein 1